MSVSLPEALLLFALHDDRGTVHSVAFMAIEHGLRGAVLAELRLRGYLSTNSRGQIRHRPDAPGAPSHPVIQRALATLHPAPADDNVASWLDALAIGVPTLRDDLTEVLKRRNILSVVDRSVMGLPTAETHPAAEMDTEVALAAELRASLADGDDIKPRQGTLLALVVACHLEAVVLGASAADGVLRADWVAERDAVVRRVRDHVSQAEGLA